MYFDYCREINICDYINNKYSIYAHTKETKNEKLQDHINLCIKYFFKIINEKHLNEVFEKLELEFLNNFSLEGRKLFREMILNTITLHDIGKVNPYFQKSRLNNDLNIKEAEKYNNSHHSILSSIVYIDIYFPKIKTFESKEKYLLLDFMMMNAYIISRHHGNLISWHDFKEKFSLDGEGEKLIDKDGQRVLFEKTLNKKIDIKIKTINKIFEIIEEKCIERYKQEQLIYRYIYERLMLSILVACDFYSTSEFMEDVEINDIGIINDIDEFYDVFKEGQIYKLIRKYEEKEYGGNKDFSHIKDINILRNEMFLDAETTLEKNLESNIFYLEAPTGSGKSNVATNLSFKLLQEDKTKNKIFYVYPFNTLVEQNINTLEKVFEKEDNILNKIAVINSIEPIKVDKEISKNEDMNLEYYKKALLNREFLNYPMILTTHVTIFKYLFGTAKEELFPLHQLANSVVVLDEIQSYKNLIWGEIITFLSCYAKLLNIKIIIMSATLPNLDKLSISKADTIKLIQNREKYFENPIFKNRVKVDYSLLESENITDDLYEHVKKQSYSDKKILLEFISKNSAYNFYNKLKEDEEIFCDVELMSGDDNIGERDRIIKKVKSINSIILVATQVVEAGVDIDMDIGYKNISMLDSEEQFLGRINRSCKKDECTVYFFKVDDAENIYKGDIRRNKDITLENESIREVLKEKNFNKFYDLVIERLQNITNGFNELNIENFFYKDVKELEFKKVEDRLRLISQQESKISVYLSSNIIVKGEELNGENLWYEYRKLLIDKKMDYSKRRVKLSEIRSKMNNFIYEIKWSYDFPYNDRLGDLYFIEDGYKYFKEGKLDKEKFITGIGDFI
ncbi:CRISPR-associated helicase Cas3' [Clostridium tetanomorphum]|uniref:CRISPR-associated helicase Cas3 n=1 Tax=Clostridium tetanomorphum TaxID=1553 RepID=A0A923E992_CLOTT|nr:CRISPR-associated helicase Cas3' [Clostridium tetanomorphum]MBC2398820.1 CRISPR-associated helicase Cas3' [Clostridium tetanomorphum]NRZ96812.1 CRISPR-associated endonuclease/helicase Cas3 [Clostridium tetanomorphum]